VAGQLAEKGTVEMDDVIFLLVALGFFAVAVAYVVACARLGNEA